MPATEQNQSEIRQNFEVEHEKALKLFTPEDKRIFINWLELGRGGLHSWDAQVLVLGLERHRQDFESGIPKDRALIAAKLLSRGEGQGKPDDRDLIVAKLAEKHNGENGLEDIRFEGFEKNFLQKFELKNLDEVTTNLADDISTAVDEFLAERGRKNVQAEQPMWKRYGERYLGYRQKVVAEETQSVAKEVTLSQQEIEEFYNNLDDRQRDTFDTACEALVNQLNGSLTPQQLDRFLSETDNFRRALGYLGVNNDKDLDTKTRLLVYQLGDEAVSKYSPVMALFLSLVEFSKSTSAKVKIEAVTVDREFFAKLPNVIRWRMGEITEYREKAEAFRQEIANLRIIGVGEGKDQTALVNDLITRAGEFQVDLSREFEVVLPETVKEQIDGVKVRLNPDWTDGDSQINSPKIIDDRYVKDLLTVIAAFSKFKDKFTETGFVPDGFDIVHETADDHINYLLFKYFGGVLTR